MPYLFLASILSSALWLGLRHSSPLCNRVTHAGRMKITEESLYFLSTRETSLLTSSRRALFDFLRRPAFLRSSFDADRTRKVGRITRVPRYLFPQHLNQGSLLFLLRRGGQTSPIYPVIPTNPLIRKGYDGDSITRERIIIPNPRSWRPAKLWEFPKSFLAPLTHFFICESLGCH